MKPTADDYRALLQTEGEALLALLDSLRADDWSRPTACAGWDVLDVLIHLNYGTALHVKLLVNGLAGRF